MTEELRKPPVVAELEGEEKAPFHLSESGEGISDLKISSVCGIGIGNFTAADSRS